MRKNVNSTILSVIIPAYNAQDTISRAVLSVLDSPTTRRKEIEVVVVDDCSTDGTYAAVEALQREHENIRLLRMPQNSGSPSGPRNLGIESAAGVYLAFLDADDWVNAIHLLNMVDTAIKEDADYTKGYLYLHYGERSIVANRLPTIPKSTEMTIQSMVVMQSTTQDFIVRREFLLQQGLRYHENLKIGEDTVFITAILAEAKNVLYQDNFFLYYNKIPCNMDALSSTQRWGNREVSDQLTAWQMARKNLLPLGLDYYAIRLYSSFRNLLLSLVQYSAGISTETFCALNRFAVETKAALSHKMNLHPRYAEVYSAILSDDYSLYCEVAKRRLLINGYDLKFVKPLVPYLEKQYNVRVDEWTGHNAHNDKQSRECLQWADIIWCEWLLGNAVYYSQHKNKNQRLLIRAHRFEVGREFGLQINYDKVDMVIAVGYYYFEEFIKAFSIPRSKMRLLPNYVEEGVYSREKNSGADSHIGLVGILPARKGFMRGLELLETLRKTDPDFKLYIMGQRPGDVSWIKNNPSEADYFESCEAFVRDHGLEDAVIYGGFVPRGELYRDIGYVLSLSDEQAPESFHLSPAEGACAGSLGLLLFWPGAEYIYPGDYIFDSLGSIADEILKAKRSPEYCVERTESLRRFVLENYGIEPFLSTLNQYLKQLFLLG